MDDHELERLVHAALVHDGQLLPTTVEEVRAAEQWLKENPIELPERLKDPMAILDRHLLLADAIAELRRLEWTRNEWDTMCCVSCNQIQKNGHAPDCTLAAVLARAGGAGDGRQETR